MAIHGNSIEGLNFLSCPSSTRTPPTSTRYGRPHTPSRVQSKTGSAARRRISYSRRTLICYASTVLGEVATNHTNMQAEQVEIRVNQKPW